MATRVHYLISLIFTSILFNFCANEHILNWFVRNQQQVEFVEAFVCTEQKNDMFSTDSNVLTRLHLNYRNNSLNWTAIKRFTNRKLAFKMVVYVDLQCDESIILLETFSTLGLFVSNLRFLLVNPPEDNTPRDHIHTAQTIPTFVSNLKMAYNSRIYLVICTRAPETTCNLTSPYRIRMNDSEVTITSSGFYSAPHPKQSRLQVDLFEDRKNFQHRPIAFAFRVVENVTFGNTVDFRDIRRDSCSQVYYILGSYVVEKANATMVALIADSIGWTIDTGAFGLVARGEADVLGISFILNSAERKKYLNFMPYSLCRTTLAFVFRQPPLSSVKNIFVIPFAFHVWFLVAVTILTLTLFLYWILQWERRMGSINDPLDSMLITCAAVMQQGDEFTLNSRSGRLLHFAMNISFMVIFTAYSAQVFVVMQAPSSSIRTLHDLYESKYMLGAEKADYTIGLITKYAYDPLRRKIRDRLMPHGKPNNNFLDLAAGLEVVRHERFAFHAQPSELYAYIEDTFYEHEKCGINEISYTSAALGSGVTKDLPFFELVKTGNFRIYEVGIFDRVNRRMYTPKPQCSGNQGVFNSVGFEQIYFPIIVFGVGVTIAACTLAIEIVVHTKLIRKGN